MTSMNIPRTLPPTNSYNAYGDYRSSMNIPRTLPPSNGYNAYGAAGTDMPASGVGNEMLDAYGKNLESQDEMAMLMERKKENPKGFLGYSLTDFMLMAVCFCVPLAIFSVSFMLISFYWQFKYTVIDWVLIVLVFGVVVFVGFTAVKRMRRGADGATDHYAVWAGALFAGVLLGYFCGLYFGWQNYVQWMRPYYSMQELNKYKEIDASTREGRGFMDSGTITFTGGSHLDVSKSAGFMNLDMYCIAPVVSSSCNSAGKCANYDFWAVGVNCCTGAPNSFACGPNADAETTIGSGAAGLRLLSYTELPFYKFAVTQAATRFGIKTTHPIFVHWVTNAEESLDGYHKNGWAGYWFALSGFAFGEVVVVALGAAGVMIVKSKYI